MSPNENGKSGIIKLDMRFSLSCGKTTWDVTSLLDFLSNCKLNSVNKPEKLFGVAELGLQAFSQGVPDHVAPGS
jgi:hypothetical protein